MAAVGKRQRQIIIQQRSAAEIPPLAGGLAIDRQKQAAGGAGDLQMVEADPGEFGERDRQQREIDAFDREPPAEPADKQPGRGGDRDGDEHAEPRPDAEQRPQRGRRVGAEPEIERMAERQLPGKSHQQIPGMAQIGEIEHQDQNRQQIAIGDDRREQEHQQQRQAERLAVPGAC